MVMSSEPTGPAKPAKGPASGKPKAVVHDLEIKDAQIIFHSVWNELEQDLGDDMLRFPKEIILLGGAPGSGKGTHTRFIQKTRGLTCPSIVVSSLLTSPEARKVIDAGYMVGDREVVGILFRKLLDPDYRDGAILDGFPRTEVQVECLKLLVDKMKELRARFFETPLRVHFRQPTIHIMVLFVDEKTSVERQIKRGHQAEAHNQEVRTTGVGECMELRPTDLDPKAARRRYQVFKEQTWEALQSLKQTFFYQSLLELDPQTYDSLRNLPLASEIILHARQDLVKRLDAYELNQTELFHQVIGLIQEKIMPVVVRHAISGLATVNIEDPLLHDSEALAMLIDIFSERGYHAVVDLHRIEIPEQVDLASGDISCRQKKVFRITIRFQGSEIRRG